MADEGGSNRIVFEEEQHCGRGERDWRMEARREGRLIDAGRMLDLGENRNRFTSRKRELISIRKTVWLKVESLYFEQERITFNTENGFVERKTA